MSTLRLLVLLCTCVPALSLTAQELDRSVVGSAGGYFSDVNVGNLHFTLGEIAVERTLNGLALERGFHQGLYELVTTSVWSAPEIHLELAVFPNPTAGLLQLRGDWRSDDRVTLRDLLGRALTDRVLPPERAELDLTGLPAGTYFLTVSRRGRPLRTLRVVRK